MRPYAYVALALGVAACGGAPAAGRSGPEAAAFSAARWVPASPTYVVAAHSMREAQRAVRDMIDGFGVLGAVDSRMAASELSMILAVDPLQADAVAGLGVDLDGGVAMFSEGFDPTFVAHLSAPDQMQAFLDQQRQRGLVTTSVVVDGAEVFNAKLVDGIQASWAIEKDWFWLHFTLSGTGPEDATWFAHSHHPAGNGWTEQYARAQQIAGGVPMHAPGVVGFFDIRALMGKLAEKAPSAVACAKLVQPIRGLAIAVDGDLQHVGVRFAIDLGPAASSVASSLVAPPPGWAVTTKNAPISAQLNLDAQLLAGWVGPCGELLGLDLGSLKATGIRGARMVLKTFDPGDKNASTGAASFDVTSSAFFARYNEMLDFPGRSFFDKERKFGPYPGHRLSPPTFPSVDYILTDRVVMVAVGDGVLDGVVAERGGAPAAPLLSIDLYPPALTASAWEMLLGLARISHPKLVAEHLLAWREGHLTLAIERDSLVLQANGNRR